MRLAFRTAPATGSPLGDILAIVIASYLYSTSPKTARAMLEAVEARLRAARVVPLIDIEGTG